MGGHADGAAFNVTIHIEEYSDAEERRFGRRVIKPARRDLFNALNKVKSRTYRGHSTWVRTSAYSKATNEGGVKLPRITIGPMHVRQAWTDSRSMDYNLSCRRDGPYNEEGQITGVLLPACQLKIDKENQQLGIENYQIPGNSGRSIVARSSR